MTVAEAVKVLNAHRYDDNDAWEIGERGVACGNVCECLIGFGDAVDVAEKLLGQKGGAS